MPGRCSRSCASTRGRTAASWTRRRSSPTTSSGVAAGLDHGTAFQTLRHLVDVDWSWREFCAGNDVGETYVWERVPLEDLASISAFCLRGGRDESPAYVPSLDDAALNESLRLGRRVRGPSLVDRGPHREPRDPAPQRAGPLPHGLRSLPRGDGPARRVRAPRPLRGATTEAHGHCRSSPNGPEGGGTRGSDDRHGPARVRRAHRSDAEAAIAVITDDAQDYVLRADGYVSVMR